MNKNLIHRLHSDQFEEPYKAISEITSQDDISNDTINVVLNLEDNLVVSDFLEKLNDIPTKSLAIFSSFIEENISNADGVFASDVIEFANKWRFRITKYCISLALDSSNDENVIMSCLNYLFECIDYSFIDETINVMNKISKDNNYYQNAQITACFYLFRITDYEKYYEKIRSLIIHGQPMNKDVLSNMLEIDYNQAKYFAHYSKLKKLIGSL